ncbi:oxidoreductase [Limtongia smithiae]|uniref:oxidoreductase n=1 Tax=Limtongia smithiae TaxID=1125753 RepID=UPI0034CD2AEC
MASTVKIAVIGGGLIGPRHAAHCKKHPDIVLVGLVDPAPHGAEVAANLDIPHFSSVSELIKIVRPDGAIVATPNHTHVAVAKELIDAGVVPLVEKPVATTLSAARELLAYADAAGVPVLVGHHRRFNPYVVAAKTEITRGGLGEVVAIDGIWTLQKPVEYFDSPAMWRRDSATGGGPILINLIHDIDLLHYLVGPITRVFAEPVRSRRGFAVNEGAAITFRFANGAVGTFLCCDNVPAPYSFEAGTGENPMIPRTGANFYRILGTSAALAVPELTRHSYEEGKEGWTEQLQVRKVEGVDLDTPPFDLQIEHFVKVVRREEKPACTVRDGLSALVVANAVQRSMDTGVPVDMGEEKQ